MCEASFKIEDLRAEMGNPKASVAEIRKYLGDTGRDPHARLEIPSFDVLLVSLDGILYGYRRIPEQKGGDKELSMFGGTVIGNTVTKEAIAEVIMAKTPIEGVVTDQITILEDQKWWGNYEYPNGDKCYLKRSCGIVHLNDEQVHELVNGDKSKFHRQIIEVAILNGRQSELYDYQQVMCRDVLKRTGILD